MTTPLTEWLTVPELVERLGVPQRKVRQLIDDRTLLADRIDGVVKVPAAFVVGSEVLDGLHGTIVVLSDSGFRDDEALHWLLNDEESLGTSPVAALAAGRKAEVRRVAQALGF